MCAALKDTSGYLHVVPKFAFWKHLMLFMVDCNRLSLSAVLCPFLQIGGPPGRDLVMVAVHHKDPGGGAQ